MLDLGKNTTRFSRVMAWASDFAQEIVAVPQRMTSVAPVAAEASRRAILDLTDRKWRRR